MATVPRIIVTAAVALFAGAAVYQARQAAHLRDQLQDLQQQRATLADELEAVQRALHGATNGLEAPAVAAVNRESVNREIDNSEHSELLKLRGEVARSRREATEQASLLASTMEFARQFNKVGAHARFEGILLQMKGRLSLAPAQEVHLRDLFKDDSFPSFDDHKAEVKALLTASQQADLAQWRREGREDEDRLYAYENILTTMKDVQAYVGLSQQQQEKAFSALMEYGRLRAKELAEERQQPGRDSSVPMTDQDWLRLQLNALRGVLTEEQMAIYQKYREDAEKVKSAAWGLPPHD